MHFPVSLGRERAVRLDIAAMRRLELAHAGKHRFRTKAELEAEIIVQPVAVDLDAPQERQQRLDLGREIERAVDARMVERLDAEAIARHEQPAPGGIPKREREHAAQLFHATLAPLLVSGEDHFRVGSGGEPVLAQLLAQFDEVVDLAVVGDDVARGRAHRLRAGVEIDDRKPQVRESCAAVRRLPAALAVRAAVPEALKGRREEPASRLAPQSCVPSDSAHGSSVSFPGRESSAARAWSGRKSAAAAAA